MSKTFVAKNDWLYEEINHLTNWWCWWFWWPQKTKMNVWGRKKLDFHHLLRCSVINSQQRNSIFFLFLCSPQNSSWALCGWISTFSLIGSPAGQMLRLWGYTAHSVYSCWCFTNNIRHRVVVWRKNTLSQSIQSVHIAWSAVSVNQKKFKNKPAFLCDENKFDLK